MINLSDPKFHAEAIRELFNAWMRKTIVVQEKYGLDSKEYFHMVTFCVGIFISELSFEFFSKTHKDSGFSLIDDIAFLGKKMLTDRITQDAN